MTRQLNAMELVGAAMVLSLVLAALFAPRLAPYDPTRAVAPTYGDPGAPSAAFPLGTDELGRDVLSRIIWGARVSLVVGVAAMVITLTIGVAIGLVSALAHAPGMSFFFSGMKVAPPTLLLSIFVAGMVGFLSAIFPAYHAAKIDIVEGLRHIG